MATLFASVGAFLIADGLHAPAEVSVGVAWLVSGIALLVTTKGSTHE